MLRFSALALTLVATVLASDVVDLTKDTFQPFLQKESLSLIEFFAPWCGHCKALAPEYETAATELKEKGIAIAKVDCTVEADVCGEFGVKGYPTLKVFRDGTPSDYKGARTSPSIVDYMIQQNRPALSEIKADGIEDFKKSSRVVLVGYFSDQESADFKAFSALANSQRDDFVFGFTTEAAAHTAAEVTAPKVVLYKSFDEGKNIHDGAHTEDEMLAFLQKNAMPLMDEIGPDNYSAFVDLGYPIAYFFYSSDEDRTTIGELLLPSAKEFKGKVSFAYIDANKYGGHAKSLNLKEEWPAFGVQNPITNVKFPYDQTTPITQEGVQKFIAGILDGSIKPSLKTEKEPVPNDGPVKVVVGTTYESVVLDKSKDVFLEVYAPWCGHCKKLAPVWEELGELAKGSNVVIAKFDGTENDLPEAAGFSVEGFPTLKFIKADTNEVLDYNGERELDALVDYIKKTAVHASTLAEKAPVDKKEETKEEHDEL